MWGDELLCGRWSVAGSKVPVTSGQNGNVKMSFTALHSQNRTVIAELRKTQTSPAISGP